MDIKYIQYILFFLLAFNYPIICKYNNNYYGKIILNKNNIKYKSFNISLHPIINYPYLLKFNFTLFLFKEYNFMVNNNAYSKMENKNNNNNFILYFLDNEESIINLVLNKSIDSLLSFDYIIITSYNLSKNVAESLIYQIFYINKFGYKSIIEFLNNNYLNNNYSNISINLHYDNINYLIPIIFVFFSKYIPLFSILIILLINKIFFKRNIYYNLCFNSSFIRIICSFIYILIILEKLKYNKIKYEYLASASVDFLIEYLNNFINDTYLSFILTSVIFILNNELKIIYFFNSEDRKIKIYFIFFILLSLINIPNYLNFKNKLIAFYIFDVLKIKMYLFEIFKTFIFIHFIKRQINIISKIIYIYSNYHLVNNINYLLLKRVFLNLIKYAFIIFLFANYILYNIFFRKYKNNEYYFNMILKCIIENYNSFIIFIYWMILNINEDNNPIYLLYLNKINNNNTKKNYLKFNKKNEITYLNYEQLKDKINIQDTPIIILNTNIKNINNNNFDKINIGLIN